MDEVVGLFPTPLLRVRGALDSRLVAGLVAVSYTHLTLPTKA